MKKCILLLFVLALSDFPAIILARPLQDLQDDMGKSAYGLCEGDCDADSDCQVGWIKIGYIYVSETLSNNVSHKIVLLLLSDETSYSHSQQSSTDPTRHTNSRVCQLLT